MSQFLGQTMSYSLASWKTCSSGRCLGHRLHLLCLFGRWVGQASWSTEAFESRFGLTVQRHTFLFAKLHRSCPSCPSWVGKVECFLDLRLGSRLSTKWGSFSVNSMKCMQASCIRQHADGTVHRVAQNYFLQPDKAISELLPYDFKGQDVFRGNVPQPRDWLRAWNACSNPTAFNNAEKHYETEDFASGRRCSVTRKCFLANWFR